MPLKKLLPSRSSEPDLQPASASGEAVPEPSNPPSRDRRPPSDLLAEQLVSAVLATAPEIGAVVRSPGSIVIGHVPPEWGEAICAAWLDIVHGRKRCADEPSDDEFDYSPRYPRPNGPTAMVANSAVTGRLTPRSVNEERVTRGLMSDRGLFVVSEGDEPLPRFLVAATDVELTFPVPTGTMLSAVASQVGDGNCNPIPDDLAVLVRPIDLASARRPSQTAADFTARLRRILTSRQAPAHPTPTTPPNAEWTLDTLPLSHDVEGWARQVPSELTAFAAGELPWVDVEHGALLAGPPGCGKTTLAGAIARSAGVPLLVTSYGTLESGTDGSTRYTEILRNMRKTFANARERAPCILLFDEIDSVLGRGQAGLNESWFAPITNTLLTETAMEAREGVVFLGATNYPDRVDPALRRSGRLDRLVLLAPPDLKQVGRIVGAHLPTLSDDDREVVATAVIGHTGADIARLARGARRRARNANRDVLAQDVILELDDDAPPRQIEQQRRIAIHEAGHALVTEVLRPGTVRFVSIRSTPSCSAALGHSSSSLPEGSSTLAAIEGYLTELLAGRAAEMVVLGEVSAGAADDLQRATSLCVAVELSLGLGTRLTGVGLLAPDEVARTLMMRPDVARAVEDRLRTAYEAAVLVVNQRRFDLERIATALVERGALTGAAITALMMPTGALH